jgi:hypothetical protein
MLVPLNPMKSRCKLLTKEKIKSLGKQDGNNWVKTKKHALDYKKM